MTPRSDVVARMFLDGAAIENIAMTLRVHPDAVEQALRRAFTAMDRKRGCR
jgi:DNA-directed RNA polymerase specialized sigma24 family protein